MRLRASLSSLTVLLVAVALVGCASNRQQQMEQAKQESTRPMEFSVRGPEPPPAEPLKLMVFGGKDQDVYLGCLTCTADEPESVFNEFGSYGSRFSPYSLWNTTTPYGSAASPMSPLNPRATNPPVVKDQHGEFHGYLTINTHMPQAYHGEVGATLLQSIDAR